MAENMFEISPNRKTLKVVTNGNPWQNISWDNPFADEDWDSPVKLGKQDFHFGSEEYIKAVNASD